MPLLAHVPELLNGLAITIILVSSSLIIGVSLAISMTICMVLGNIFLRNIISFLIFFIRGTPMLVQIFLIYYAVGQVEWLRSSELWVILREPMACAIIALSVNTACYTTVLLLGGINSIPKNEIAACDALGMSKWLSLRHVIFPRALRIVLPAYSNEVLMVLKSTSLASTITILDLTGMMQKVVMQTYDIIGVYLIVGIIYLFLNMAVTMGFKLLQWQFNRVER
jgi:His/Glu/Gln/Arg/opine family amino acid ABC transporter permease subunit